jgi:hypothetical protein
MLTLKQPPGKVFSPLSIRESRTNEKRYRRNIVKYVKSRHSAKEPLSRESKVGEFCSAK